MKKAALATAATGFLSREATGTVPKREGGRILNAYYFRAHMYTLVPHQVREDLQWMADIGTNAVSIAILEQDLRAAVENVEIVANEANKLGMDLMVVPSRWGGLLAGAPKVPSVFTIQNPQAWMVTKDGGFYLDENVGTHSSFHYPETVNFFKASLDKIFNLWNVKGIIWDEPKVYDIPDFSNMAKTKISAVENISLHNKAFSNFFSELNTHIKTNYPEVSTNLFIYANHRKEVIDSIATIANLDYMGCDGRPWSTKDTGQVEQEGKVLLGPGQSFLEAARKNDKKSLLLVENHNMTADNNTLMDKRLPEVLALKPEHLIYYYYPRNLDKPNENMAIIRKHMKNF